MGSPVLKITQVQVLPAARLWSVRLPSDPRLLLEGGDMQM